MALYFLVPILICAVYYYFTRNFNYWKNKNVKGPKPIPLFGNFKEVALRKQHMGMLYKDIYRQYPDEKVVGMYRMTAPCLLIRDLDIIKQILIKDFESFPDRGTYYSKDGLTQNIFHSDPDTWKALRAKITSAFTTSKFKSLYHLISDKSDKFVEYIQDNKSVNNEPDVDIYQLFLKYAVGSTMSSIFGLNVDTYNESKVFEEVDTYFSSTYDRELDMLFPGFMTKLNRSMLTKGAIKFSHEVVQAGLQQLQTSDVKTDILNIMDVLRNFKKEGNILYQNKSQDNGQEPFLEITDTLLAGQAWICYFAGYGNSSLTLTYAMYHLARNPEVQETLREEIDRVMERNNGNLTYDALKEMKYLDMVFEETLRLHPLTNAVMRRAHADIKLEGLDFVIEKGTDLVISPYSVQHDEKNFPDPEKFDPLRFAPANVSDRHPCAFLSFGAGRRSCLGSRFAYLQFGICVAKVLYKYRVEPTKNTISNIDYDPWQLLLTPHKRIHLKLVSRET